MTSNTAYSFLILALTIGVGFAAMILAKRYRISQVIFLMLFGILLGPVFHLIDVNHDSLIRQIYPFLSSLALIILLFDGGISLNIFSVVKTIGKSFVFTVLVFVASVFISLALVPIFHFSIIDALLIGALLSGISSAIVLTMIEQVSLSEDAKTLLSLESVLNDSLVVLVVFLLIQVYQDMSNFALSTIVRELGISLIISTVIGGALAFLWNEALKFLKEFELDYMLTLAVLFFTYFVSDFFGGNGGLAVFVFGLVFGNLHALSSKLLSIPILQQKRIIGFQEEVTFFTRTFFFTYIGLLFPLWSIDVQTVLEGVLLTALYLLVRYMVSVFLLKDKDALPIVVGVLPRGLAAAVGVGLLLQYNIVINHVSELVFLVILLTNIIATFSVWEFGKAKRAEVDELEELIEEKEESGEGEA
jgi:cell volume regulation protein A